MMFRELKFLLAKIYHSESIPGIIVPCINPECTAKALNSIFKIFLCNIPTSGNELLDGKNLPQRVGTCIMNKRSIFILMATKGVCICKSGIQLNSSLKILQCSFMIFLQAVAISHGTPATAFTEIINEDKKVKAFSFEVLICPKHIPVVLE